MEHTSKQGDEFTSYPTNKVIGTIDSAEDTQTAIDALLEAGFNIGDIEFLTGEEGARHLDVTGKEHGLLARLGRFMLKFGDAEPKIIKQVEQDMLAGRYVIAVLAEKSEMREKVREILESHGGHSINFFGKWVIENLEP